jgi:hypothetical protein
VDYAVDALAETVLTPRITDFELEDVKVNGFYKRLLQTAFVTSSDILYRYTIAQQQVCSVMETLRIVFMRSLVICSSILYAEQRGHCCHCCRR